MKILTLRILTPQSGYFEDLYTPAIQVQTPPLEGPRILGEIYIYITKMGVSKNRGETPKGWFTMVPNPMKMVEIWGVFP